jgi:hypothetical protein
MLYGGDLTVKGSLLPALLAIAHLPPIHNHARLNNAAFAYFAASAVSACVLQRHIAAVDPAKTLPGGGKV